MTVSIPNSDPQLGNKVLEILNKNKEIGVYFGIYRNDINTADHIGLIKIAGNSYEYKVEGHGIGSNSFSGNDLNELLELIIRHNKFFNLTKNIHFIVNN